MVLVLVAQTTLLRAILSVSATVINNDFIVLDSPLRRSQEKYYIVLAQLHDSMY
jgi:hypothetical protein